MAALVLGEASAARLTGLVPNAPDATSAEEPGSAEGGINGRRCARHTTIRGRQRAGSDRLATRDARSAAGLEGLERPLARLPPCRRAARRQRPGRLLVGDEWPESRVEPPAARHPDENGSSG